MVLGGWLCRSALASRVRNARTTPGQAVDLAQARYPTSRFVAIDIPKPEQQPYLARLAAPNNLNDKGETQVFVDRKCPIILTSIDGEIRVASEVFRAVVYPLHRNLMLGPFGSAIVFPSSLLLPVSFVTGLLLWLDRRKARRSAR
ncbi:PepSY domain-containing protein [Bradyrhizobium sp.]|uniref:PepSY domain-containing protein n=1 Tax=Bradyrhizobium sp. TaxID=376 RepID=UPI0039C899D5